MSAVPRRRKLCIACDDIFMLSIKISSCAHAAAPPSKIATTLLGCNFVIRDADFLSCLQGIKLAAFRCEARSICRRRGLHSAIIGYEYSRLECTTSQLICIRAAFRKVRLRLKCSSKKMIVYKNSLEKACTFGYTRDQTRLAMQ